MTSLRSICSLWLILSLLFLPGCGFDLTKKERMARAAKSQQVELPAQQLPGPAQRYSTIPQATPPPRQIELTPAQQVALAQQQQAQAGAEFYRRQQFEAAQRAAGRKGTFNAGSGFNDQASQQFRNASSVQVPQVNVPNVQRIPSGRTSSGQSVPMGMSNQVIISGQSGGQTSSIQQGQTVFISTGEGKRWHANRSCPSLARSNIAGITLFKAQQQGFTPCQKCAK